MVIKVTNEYLSKRSLAKTGKNRQNITAVYEDILWEATILKHLSEDERCPKSIVKFQKFLKSFSISMQYFTKQISSLLFDKTQSENIHSTQINDRPDDYYLAMEDGGGPLFDFITSAHKMIALGMLDVSHWIEVVKIIFKQMIECIEFIHSKNVCHFDISMENFLINDVLLYLDENIELHKQKILLATEDIQIKLCDFGTFLAKNMFKS